MKSLKFSTFWSIGFLALVLFPANSAFAERKIVLMGGGGEPKSQDTTIFDDTLTNMDNYLQKNKWGQVAISFNGGHAKTEASMKSKFAGAAMKSTFSKSNYAYLIKNYADQIRSGELKDGDQLLIVIDSHGAIKTDDSLTHQIAVGADTDKLNLTHLNPGSTVSLDALKDLSDLAIKKGIKLGILDFSCHSGNSLTLANDNTCVISSTGKNHFGYNTFADNFIKKMNAGKSLEDVFLETRKDTTDSSFPMISTPEGQAINRDIYPNLTPYLYYYDENPDHDKMADYLLEASSNIGLCARQNQYDELQKQLDSLRAASALNMNKSMPEIAKIKDLVSVYKRRQDNYINLLRSWGSPELSRREQFRATATVKKTSVTLPANYSWKELIETDLDTILKDNNEAKLSAKTDWELAKCQASIEMYSKAKAKKMEILARYPNLKDVEKNLQLQLNEMKGTRAVAEQIAVEERKLYDSMYSNLRQQNNQKNACKDFVL